MNKSRQNWESCHKWPNDWIWMTKKETDKPSVLMEYHSRVWEKKERVANGNRFHQVAFRSVWYSIIIRHEESQKADRETATQGESEKRKWTSACIDFRVTFSFRRNHSDGKKWSHIHWFVTHGLTGDILKDKRNQLMWTSFVARCAFSGENSIIIVQRLANVKYIAIELNGQNGNGIIIISSNNLL